MAGNYLFKTYQPEDYIAIAEETARWIKTTEKITPYGKRWNQSPASLAPLSHSLARISELLPPRRLVEIINTFFAIINTLRSLQKISASYRKELHPGCHRDLYELHQES